TRGPPGPRHGRPRAAPPPPGSRPRPSPPPPASRASSRRRSRGGCRGSRRGAAPPGCSRGTWSGCPGPHRSPPQWSASCSGPGSGPPARRRRGRRRRPWTKSSRAAVSHPGRAARHAGPAAARRRVRSPHMAEPFEVRPLLAQPTPPPYEPLQVHPRVFTGPQCDRIVELGCSLPSDAAALEGEEGEATNDPSLRSSRTSWIPVRDDTEWIYRKLATVAERANRRYRFELTGFAEDLQFTTYDHPGAFYTWH